MMPEKIVVDSVSQIAQLKGLSVFYMASKLCCLDPRHLSNSDYEEPNEFRVFGRQVLGCHLKLNN